MAAGLATALAASLLLPVAQSCSLGPRQTGRIHAEPLPGGSSCAKPPEPELRGCFIDTLEHLVAPPVLHDLEFDDSLGTGLSC